jgi:ribosomal peptide maturation radical SAM protein 1
MGEADESFPVLVRLLLAGRLKGAARNAIPGLLYRSKTGTQCTSPPQPVRDMDELPIPDYSDYFRDLDLSAAGLFVVPTLLFETSRGCWWGARHHCRFCGLNGTTLSFRSKTAKRALEEVKYLVSQWQIDMLQAVDNVVNMAHFRDLFPALAHNERPLRFFYEIRANLSREQVKTLRDAGVVHVQPGIESMNQHILDLMGKGTTPFLNIQVLKWCKEYDIHADWNLLYGFPGETEADYKQLLRLLPEIRFLNPPRACGPVRLDRFSPYFMSAAR